MGIRMRCSYWLCDSGHEIELAEPQLPYLRNGGTIPISPGMILAKRKHLQNAYNIIPCSKACVSIIDS